MKASVLLLLLAAMPLLADDAPVMVLEGDLSAVHDKGVFTVFDPLSREIVEWWKARWEARWNSQTPLEELPPCDDLPLGLVGQAPVAPDGTFRLEIAVDRPRVVWFVVMDEDARDVGRPTAVRNSNRFILEPGELRLRMKYSNYSIVTGGHYNDAVYGSWRLSDEYREAQAEYSRLLAPEDGETEEARLERFSRRAEVEDRLEAMEWEGIQPFSSGQHDPLIRQLAADSLMASSPDQLGAIRGRLESIIEAPASGEEIPSEGFNTDLPPAVVVIEKNEPDSEAPEAKREMESEVETP